MTAGVNVDLFSLLVVGPRGTINFELVGGGRGSIFNTL